MLRREVILRQYHAVCARHQPYAKTKQRDCMAHVDYLARWSERNRDYAAEIVTPLKDQLPCDLPCTNRIAQWAYEQTETARGLTWIRVDELVKLSAEGGSISA